jgi:hypothetical protein
MLIITITPTRAKNITRPPSELDAMLAQIKTVVKGFENKFGLKTNFAGCAARHTERDTTSAVRHCW